MKIQDLRVGNYVWLHKDGDKKIYQIDSGYDLYKLDESDCADVSPIEITEEIIKKLVGKNYFNQDVIFVKEKDGRYGYKHSIGHCDYNYVIERDFEKEQSHFFGIEYTDCPNPDDDYIFHSFAFDVKHLHRLQNLYQDCTKNTLILK